LYIARALAEIVRDENGVLLFDARDDVQMTELMALLEDVGPGVSRQIQNAYNAINRASTEEVGPEGNSRSASSS
jgi:hypothetical protein